MDVNCYSNTWCLRKEAKNNKAMKEKRKKCKNSIQKLMADTHTQICQTAYETMIQVDANCRMSFNNISASAQSTLQKTCIKMNSQTQNFHPKQNIKIQSRNNCYPSQSRRTLLYHFMHIALVFLVILTLAAPIHAQDTAESSHALFPSSPGSVKEIFYPPESWSIEELEMEVKEEAVLQLTHYSANVGYLFRTRITSTQNFDEATLFHFKVKSLYTCVYIQSHD